MMGHMVPASSGLLGAVSLHPLSVLYFAAALAVGLVVHEYAHAWAAVRLGDLTPRSMGRLSLNPKVHADPFGTVALPAILLLVVLFSGSGFVFAYAKPMPVNAWNLRNKSRDPVLIAMAGPVASFLLAVVFGVVGRVTCGTAVLTDILRDAVFVNVILAAFNLVPMPPLDGARAISQFLPVRAREVMGNLEQFGALFILLVLFILPRTGLVQFVDTIANGLLSLIPGSHCLRF